MDLRFKRVLFLGCHLDDIEFGCGGLISRLVNEGNTSILLFILSQFNKDSNNKITIRRDIEEAYMAAQELGIRKEQLIIKTIPGQIFEKHAQKIRESLLEIRTQFQPEYIFFPSKHDIHQDHFVLCREAERIFRNNCCLGYELIRSTYHLEPNVYFGLEDKEVNAKICAINQYKSQSTQSAGYYFNENLIRSAAMFRGGQCNREFAEAYELYYSTF